MTTVVIAEGRPVAAAPTRPELARIPAPFTECLGLCGVCCSRIYRVGQMTPGGFRCPVCLEVTPR
ncbi:hypothetical protein ACU686_40325 [Yinghuangia aomiensis]